MPLCIFTLVKITLDKAQRLIACEPLLLIGNLYEHSLTFSDWHQCRLLLHHRWQGFQLLISLHYHTKVALQTRFSSVMRTRTIHMLPTYGLLVDLLLNKVIFFAHLGLEELCLSQNLPKRCWGVRGENSLLTYRCTPFGNHNSCISWWPCHFKSWKLHYFLI